MNKILFLCVAFTFIFKSPTFALDNAKFPEDSVVLKSPPGSAANWKEINRYLGGEHCIVEYIPIDQTVEDIKDIIIIQKTGVLEDTPLSAYLESLKRGIYSQYSGKITNWKVIEENKNDCIFEWTLEDTAQGQLVNDIIRIFKTNCGVYHISYTRKDKVIHSDEKEQRIKLLKESACIISFEEAKTSKDILSFADKFKNTIDLGHEFKNWEVKEDITLENGYSVVTYVPSAPNKYKLEWVCIETYPNLGGKETVKTYYDEKKKRIRECYTDSIFKILEQNQDEILYKCYFKVGNQDGFVVGRNVLDKLGFLMVTYGCVVIKNEIELMQEKLKQISPK